MKILRTCPALLIPCAAVLAALTLAGCGHKDDDTATSNPTSAPVNSPPPAPGASAMNGAAPGGPGGTMMNKPSTNPNGALGDGNITLHVKNALIADKAVKFSDINVDTKSETVVLRGTQVSQAAITAANADAKKITGVKNVINQLTVKAP